MSDEGLDVGSIALVGGALAAVVYMRRPGRHFTWGEATRTSKPLDNSPDLLTMVRMRVHGTTVMDKIRDKFGPVDVTSWYRSPAVNKAVGGSDGSDHMDGVATDFYARHADGRTVGKWLWDHQAQLPLKQVIFYRSTGHLHVSSHDAPWNPSSRRAQFLETAHPNGATMESWRPK